MIAKRESSFRYHCWLAEFLETTRWDCFVHKHDIYEFVPYAPFNEDYFGLSVDVRKDIPADFYPDRDPFIHYDYIGWGTK